MVCMKGLIAWTRDSIKRFKKKTKKTQKSSHSLGVNTQSKILKLDQKDKQESSSTCSHQMGM